MLRPADDMNRFDDRRVRRSRLRTKALLGAMTLWLAFAGCRPSAPIVPQPANEVLATTSFVHAFDAELDDSTAFEGYLDVVDRASRHPSEPLAAASALAALDALARRRIPGLESVDDHAIAYRGADFAARIASRLERAWSGFQAGQGENAWLRGAIATTMHALALRRGDEAAASTWALRRGCATEAAVFGPIDAAPLASLGDPSVVEPSVPLARSFAGVPPFSREVLPVKVHADACALDVMSATSVLNGTRVVVVDVETSHSERATFAVTSRSATVLDVGGVRTLERSFELGSAPVQRFAMVTLPPGKTRAVLRVASRGDGESVELDVWGADGNRLATRAPEPGDVASGIATRPEPIEFTGEGSGADMNALALLALGDARSAEHRIEAALLRNDDDKRARARLDLVYARAMQAAMDIPDAKLNERARSALERVLAVWPRSWEAAIGQANLIQRRRGPGEGPIEALKALDSRFAKAPWSGVGDPSRVDRMLLVHAATLALQASMNDLAARASGALDVLAPGSALAAQVRGRVDGQVGKDAVDLACGPLFDRSDLGCFSALKAALRMREAHGELDRLRRLRGSAEAYLGEDLDLRLLEGDATGALAVYDRMPKASRALLGAVELAAARGDAKAALERLARDRTTARDAPFALSTLDLELGSEDVALALEREGAAVVAEDRQHAFFPGAGTAVLRHFEDYVIEPSGLVRYVVHDLRRVTGTNDVESGAATYDPHIDGRGAPRMLRRRVHKQDGRVIEPDAPSGAAQANADLSQLAAGDYVEQILIGHALPGDSGQITIDSPDLMPERTSVLSAQIRLRSPRQLALSTWAHPLFGKAERRSLGEDEVVTWRLVNALPRRLEDGVPRTQQAVGISVGTLTWPQVARAMRENVASLEDHDPFVARWSAEVAGTNRSPSRALVERIVAASGKAIRVASGAELSDASAVFASGPQAQSARSMLEVGSGSRSWVIYRALCELGVSAEIAVAEVEPWPTSTFPAHVGRFRRPLVVARVPDAVQPIWIDADVEGPPLPPGRVSPELRGRSAMLTSGEVIAVGGSSEESEDQVDVRLSVDPQGDAKGTFTAKVHGRSAQALAEAFETIVGSDRTSLLRSVVLGWLPWADVEEVALASTEGAWEIGLRATISIHGYARPEGKTAGTWVLPGLEPVHGGFPRPFVSTLAAVYAARAARASDLAVTGSIQYHVHRRVELPPKVKFTSSPDGVSIRDARIVAARKSSFDGRAIEDDFSLSLPTQTIAAESYGSFVELVRGIDGGFMAGARVEVKR